MTDLSQIPFKHEYTEDGYCRVHYSRAVGGSKRSYALVQMGMSGDPLGWVLHSTTDDEPDCPIKGSMFSWALIPPPTGNSGTDDEVRAFLQNRLDWIAYAAGSGTESADAEFGRHRGNP